MKKISVICVILAGIAWGTSGLFVTELAKHGFTSLELASLRCIVGTVFAFVYTMITDRKSFRKTGASAPVFAVGGMSFFGMSAFYYMAMREASVSTAAVLLYIAPILVMLFSVLFWGERLTIIKVVAVIGAFIGCGLVTGIIGGLRFGIRGILYGVLSGVFYAVYSISIKAAAKRKIKPSVTTAYIYGFAAICSVVFINPQNTAAKIASSSLGVIILIVLLGFVTGFLAATLFSKGMEKLPAGIASSMATIEPLTQTVLSVIFLGEVLSIPEIVGILFIIASVTVLSRQT